MAEMLTRDETKHRKWLWNCGYTDTEIAVREGVTREAIGRWRRRNHLPHNRTENRGGKQ